MQFLISLGLAFLGLIALVLVIAIVFVALRWVFTGIAIGLLEAPGFMRNIPPASSQYPGAAMRGSRG